MSSRTSWLDRPVGVRGILVAVAVAVSVIALAVSCTAGATSRPAPTGPFTPPPADNLTRRDIRVIDVTVGGRTVSCILWDKLNGAGLSCDWSKGGAQ